MFLEELKRRNVIRVGVAYVVAAWVLMQVVDLLAPILEWPDSVARIALYLLLVGFPIALLMSWFYQITPDGISLDEEIDPARSGSKVLDQRLNLIVIALLCAAVILFAYDKWWPREALDPSVAVLPFINMSGLEENEYFSDGLTETLLHVLAQTSELRVSARTSSFAFKNEDIDVREIARQLGVAHVLEGSVQRVEDRVRITVQLIRATDGTHLWSAKYDRTLDNVFVIHDEVAASVSAALTDSLFGGGGAAIPEGIATQNIEAFDLYLRALPEFAKGSFGAFRNAEELLKTALVKDPGFTDAKVLLAETYIAQADTGARDRDETDAIATALFEQILIEQPSNATARSYQMVFDLVDSVNNGDLAARPASIESFLELVNEAPNNVIVRQHLAMLLNLISKQDEALVQLKKAVSLDPLNPFPYHLIADTYINLREWDAAREAITRSLEIEPQQPNAVSTLAQVFRATGDAVGFIHQVQKATAMDPLDFEQPYAIAELLYELELFDEGDRFKSQVLAIAPNSPAAHTLQIIRAIRADNEAESLAVARQLIKNDTDNRRRAWIRSFRHLMLTAVLRGRTQEELEFINEYAPSFADWAEPPVSWKVGLARAQTLEIWRDLDPGQGVLDRVDITLSGFAALELSVSRVQIVHIDVLLLQGDLEGAIDAALANLFSHSVLDHLSIKDRFVTPLYANFVADPRIATALEEWDDELAQAREDVRQYFATAE